MRTAQEIEQEAKEFYLESKRKQDEESLKQEQEYINKTFPDAIYDENEKIYKLGNHWFKAEISAYVDSIIYKLIHVSRPDKLNWVPQKTTLYSMADFGEFILQIEQMKNSTTQTEAVIVFCN